MPFTYNSSPVATATVNTTLSRYSGGSATTDSLVLTGYSVASVAMAAGTSASGDQISFTNGDDLFVWDDFTASAASRATIGGASRLAQSVASGVTQAQAIDNFYGGDGNDVFSFTTASGAAATYDAVSVKINGDTGDDVIWAAGGNDVLYGGAGNDWIDGGAGNDVINGDGGNNTLAGGAGDDVVYGGSGDNTLWGGDGNDLLTAGSGANTIWGGAGNDTIWGGGVNDTLFGDDGNDNMAGGGGNNTLFGGAGNDTLNGGGNDDLLDGGAGGDTLWGSIGNNVLWGGDGSDLVQSYGGNDYLYGGGAAGSSKSGDSNTLWGGGGDDWYYISRTDNFTTINDGSGKDNLVLMGQFATSGTDEFVAGTGVHETTDAKGELAVGYVLGSNKETTGVDVSVTGGSIVHVVFDGGTAGKVGVDFYTGQIQTITLWNNDVSVTGHQQEIYNWNGDKLNFTFDHYA